MRRCTIRTFALALMLTSNAAGAANESGEHGETTKTTYSVVEHRSFEIAPVAPPTPALKYQLLFDDSADRRPGNAAILYLQAALLLGAPTEDKAEQALEAYEAKDMERFAELADALERPDLFQQLDLAARREQCDWEPPFREMGAYTLLPHLSPLRAVARLIRVRTLREIEQGKIDDALAKLRSGYELSDNIGREPIIVSGLVSIAIMRIMNSTLAELMSHPEASNLYWALSTFPPRQPVFRNALDGERGWAITSIPALMKLRGGEDLSADEWRSLLDYVWRIMHTSADNAGQKTPPDPVQDAKPETLRAARQQYAQSRGMTADEADNVEPIIALGTYYYQQYQTLFDEQYKLRGLPYPVLLPKARELAARAEKLQAAQPGNPFHIFNLGNVVEPFARADRELAALTAVEALRSYAAANDGKLPDRLDQVTETPVPENPMTGKPFDYSLENGSATLSDKASAVPLNYSVTIRRKAR